MKKVSIPLIVLLGLSSPAVGQQISGSFEFRWLDSPNGDHRDVELMSEVVFVSSDGTVWTVPVGTTVDGASIPRLLWTFAGSPFVGKYRRASVFHDHYCDIGTRPQAAVHLMFREVMLADGASWPEAYSKWAAVVFAGLCPQQTASLQPFDRLLADRPDAFDPSIIAQFSLPAPERPSLEFERFEQDLAVAREVLTGEDRIVYDSLVDLRFSHTDEALAELEEVLSDVTVTSDRFEELVVLADQTVPSRVPFR
ncbi:MAG: DUF1353 domain-containing protein [Cohaesibacteraceae bacterium]